MATESECISEYDDCLLSINSTFDGTALLKGSFYQRSNSIAMYTIWAGYTATFIFFSALFYYNRTIQPIKSRHPLMVLSSALGGWLLATNYTMANYVTGMHLWPCPFTNWAMWLGFSLFLLPFPIRALHLFLMFHRNVNKVRDHRIIVETEKLKMNKVVRKTHARLVANNPSFRGAAQFIPEEEEVDQIVISAVSSNKWHSLKRLEKYLPHVFWCLIFICFVFGLVRQLVPELGLGPDCRGCIVTPNSTFVLCAVVFLVLSTQIISVVLLQQQRIKDQYMIAGELKMISFLWLVMLVPACALALNGISCSKLEDVHCSGSFPIFTDFCYQNFVAQHWFIILCAVFTFVSTVMVPVVAAVRKGKKRVLNELPKNAFDKFKALETLQDCLKDEEVFAAFQQFCVQSFCVELVLFWKDAEAFRFIMENQALEMRIHALDIYNKYLNSSGSLFVELPEHVQSRMDTLLGLPAALYLDQGEDFDFSELNHVTSDLFVEAQDHVIRQMEELFLQFKESDGAKELYKRFQVLTAAAMTFQQRLGH